MSLFDQQTTQDRKTFFVETILPLPLPKVFTYRVPYEMNAQLVIGKRVIVPFGKSKIYTAIIYRITEKAPELYQAKYLMEVLDDQAIVDANQFKLWDWIANYYLCHLGEVMQAALPSSFKLASETRIALSQNATDIDKSGLSDKAFLIVDALEIQPELSIEDISKLLGQKNVLSLLKSLLDKGILNIYEEISEKYKPRIKTFIHLNSFYEQPEHKRALFEQLGRAPKQLEVLLTYFKLQREQKEISKADLTSQSETSAGPLKTLIDKEILIQEERVIDRLLPSNTMIEPIFALSATQQDAIVQIQSNFDQKNVVLLHGVTSSGKTQVYIQLIEEVINHGKQVLYLLPEIALTAQMVERLRKHFGDQIGVYHSRFNEHERAEIWQKVMTRSYKVVVGARSTVFLPFIKLGLIIVDEEHESSYKQYDPAPRYHARDTAIYLAHIHGAKVLLGSATPSLESFYNTKIRKYGLVTLNDRFGGVHLPQIEVVNIAEETKRKAMRAQFSSVLIKEISEALERREQIILFQNRRGYTPILLCATCGHTSKCIHCDVSLTYHKSSGQLHCHYCGYKREVLNNCPACGSARIEQKGAGTEKIEDELQLIFENARIARMDLDSTRKRNSLQTLLNDFEDHRIDILVGTQMLAKGLDFSNVSTIGIINADSLLSYPDFRSFERSFQLLSQVAGRAGRRKKRGKVIIQTYDTQHRVIQQVINNDYLGLFDTEIIERRNFHYPPIYRLIRIDLKHKEQYKLHQIAEQLGRILHQQFGERILGPEVPLVGKIRNYYIQSILIKAEKENVSAIKLKEALRNTLINFEGNSPHKGVHIQIDVDPY